MPKSLAQFLAEIETNHPDRLLRLTEAIDPQKHEVTAYLDALDRKGLDKIVVFENVTGLDGQPALPFVSNVFASRGLCALALDLPYESQGMELVEEFGRKERRAGSVEIVADAPCQEIVLEGERRRSDPPARARPP